MWRNSDGAALSVAVASYIEMPLQTTLYAYARPSRSSPKASKGWRAVWDDFRNFLIQGVA